VLGGTALTTRRLPVVVGAAVIAVDQLVKWWAVATLPGKPIVLVDGFLELRYHANTGASFSMLQGSGALIALVAMAAAVFILVIARRIENRPELVALGLIFGGAVGNLLDRIFRGPGLLDGGVVDFVDFSFFPAFNVADSAITIGALAAVWFAFRQR
jgi:signal peptidase II